MEGVELLSFWRVVKDGWGWRKVVGIEEHRETRTLGVLFSPRIFCRASSSLCKRGTSSRPRLSIVPKRAVNFFVMKTAIERA